MGRFDAVKSVLSSGAARIAPLERERLKRGLKSGRHELLVPAQSLGGYFEEAILDLADDVDAIGYFEAGVYAGQSLAVWWNCCRELGVTTKVTGADSFQGLPASVAGDGGGWAPGQFRCPRPVTEWNLDRLGVPVDEVLLVEGWFEETLDDGLAKKIETVHVAMLDADAYSSTVPVLDFLTGTLADRSWIIFDDWHSGEPFDLAVIPSDPSGAEQAFREWLAGDGARWSVESMGTYDLTLNGLTHPAGHVFRLTGLSAAEAR